MVGISNLGNRMKKVKGRVNGGECYIRLLEFPDFCRLKTHIHLSANPHIYPSVIIVLWVCVCHSFPH